LTRTYFPLLFFPRGQDFLPSPEDGPHFFFLRAFWNPTCLFVLAIPGPLDTDCCSRQEWYISFRHLLPIPPSSLIRAPRSASSLSPTSVLTRIFPSSRVLAPPSGSANSYSFWTSPHTLFLSRFWFGDLTVLSRPGFKLIRPVFLLFPLHSHRTTSFLSFRPSLSATIRLAERNAASILL